MTKLANRSAVDLAIIEKADTMREGAHHPLHGVEYRPSAHAYAAQCSGCGYWTGYTGKTKAAKMILSHCRAFADAPPMAKIEMAEARLAGLRKERKQIGGRGSAQKKANKDVWINALMREIEQMKEAGR